MSELRILKYRLPITIGEVPIRMPRFAKILKIAQQRRNDGWLTIWATVPPEQGESLYRFQIVPTGGDAPSAIWTHLDTCVCTDGELVWHVYEHGDNPYGTYIDV